MYDLATLFLFALYVTLTALAILATLYVVVPLAYRRRTRYRRHTAPIKR